jgi:hypothetical protein
MATEAHADEIVIYHIQDGDTFLALAYKFGVDPDDLAAMNGLKDPDILAIGQQLWIKVPTATNPFGLTVPDRREDLVADVQLEREPAAESAGITELAPPPASLLKMIASFGPVGALQLWQPSPDHPDVIPAPIYSQFDGTIWAGSNCGPSSLAMGLAAIGINADQTTLRHQANAQMGSADPDEGTTWEALEAAAWSVGAGTKGLVGGHGYRAWGVDDLKKELGLGHPVLLLVRYRALPDHAGSAFYGDHYIVALGFDRNGDLVYNDPAGNVAHGNHRRLTLAELDHAWSNTWVGQVHTAMALYR